MNDSFETIKKVAQVMTEVEAVVTKNAPIYLPRHRNRLIDLTTLSLQRYEDDFFTYERLKNIVANTLQAHEAGNEHQFFIDVERSSPKRVTLVRAGNHVELPASAFLASVMTSAVSH